jgi:hypothetical protein
MIKCFREVFSLGQGNIRNLAGTEQQKQHMEGNSRRKRQEPKMMNLRAQEACRQGGSNSEQTAVPNYFSKLLAALCMRSLHSI